MNKIEKKLIQKALKKYENIRPVGNKESFDGCFSRYGRMYLFWFNTDDDTTHVVTDTDEVPKDITPS